MKMRKYILIAITAWLCSSASAQTGIRAGIEYGSTQKKLNLNYLVGLDRDLGERISIGLDALFIPKKNSFEGSSSYYVDYYELTTSSFGLQYRSMYYFGGAGYIASTIGFRNIKMNMVLTELTTDAFGYDKFITRTLNKNTMIIPIGLRLGARGELDGWYQDLYLNVGYNIGSSKKPYGTEVVLEKSDEISGLWFSLGYAFGVGW